ncbi:MAG: hypothetical protein R3E53_12605 [Myxococcota bacterium]
MAGTSRPSRTSSRRDAFKKVTNWGAMNILRGRPQHTTYRHD